MPDGFCHQTVTTTSQLLESFEGSSPILADIYNPSIKVFKLYLVKYLYKKEMSVRTSLVILFFWAALTIVTPILVRMSSSNYSDEPEEVEGMTFLSRRTLVSTASPPALAPAPCGSGGVQIAVTQRYPRKALVKH
ncbi:unnamed protein product [Lactuca virosa]|uniref:Uncharacterized protein n=1 Tax=Lactuca virosa TaxID=75947 RepID=A0AAU9NYH1_9ASTR|nr:unnamed protein product [Lactuca virosa]